MKLKHLNHAQLALWETCFRVSSFSTVNNKNKKSEFPVDTEPHVGATNVPGNVPLLTEQICGYLQITKKETF